MGTEASGLFTNGFHDLLALVIHVSAEGIQRIQHYGRNDEVGPPQVSVCLETVMLCRLRGLSPGNLQSQESERPNPLDKLTTARLSEPLGLHKFMCAFKLRLTLDQNEPMKSSLPSRRCSTTMLATAPAASALETFSSLLCRSFATTSRASCVAEKPMLILMSRPPICSLGVQTHVCLDRCQL